MFTLLILAIVALGVFGAMQWSKSTSQPINVFGEVNDPKPTPDYESFVQTDGTVKLPKGTGTLRDLSTNVRARKAEVTIVADGKASVTFLKSATT